MKLSKEDLIKKVSEKIENEDVAIELMEDISDSFEATDTTELDAAIAELNNQLEDLNKANAELKAKYKERFLSGTDSDEPEKEKDLEEETTVDIKEI